MNDKVLFLKQSGIDVDTALTYLGDMETFDEILKDFYDGLDNQMAELEQTKKNNDMPNYAILVHALKSNCRSLGITNFAALAYEEEMKSKEGNSMFINEHFPKLVEEKEKTKEVISKYLGI